MPQDAFTSTERDGFFCVCVSFNAKQIEEGVTVSRLCYVKPRVCQCLFACVFVAVSCVIEKQLRVLRFSLSTGDSAHESVLT